MFGPSYNAEKLKLNLKLVVTRVKLLQKKHENQSIIARKEVAALLEKGKEDLARIKVEAIIREDYTMEAMEMIEMYCSLLQARFGLIDHTKACDPGIREAVCSLMWAAPRLKVDITELGPIQQLFAARFGKEFALAAMENRGDVVNARIMVKLGVSTPNAAIVDGYLEGIAKTYKVDWTPSSSASCGDSICASLDLDHLPSVPCSSPACDPRASVQSDFVHVPSTGPSYPATAYAPPPGSAYPPPPQAALYPPPAAVPPPAYTTAPQAARAPLFAPAARPAMPEPMMPMFPSVPGSTPTASAPPPSFVAPPSASYQVDQSYPPMGGASFAPTPTPFPGPAPYVTPSAPPAHGGDAASVGAGSTDTGLDFDELTARFARLKDQG